MADGSLITEELKKLADVHGESTIFKIEDVPVATSKLVGMVEKETIAGNMLFYVVETTYLNHNDDVGLR